jgi:hypothetical protein
MNLFGIGAVIDSVGKIASDLITTDKERLEMALREKEIDQRLDIAQISVNQSEAQHSSIFVAGWRPAIGWIGAAAMAYQFLLYPIMLWGWVYFQGTGWIPKELTPPPVLDADQLWVILSGILGIAGMRSFEKTKGVARQ